MDWWKNLTAAEKNVKGGPFSGDYADMKLKVENRKEICGPHDFVAFYVDSCGGEDLRAKFEAKCQALGGTHEAPPQMQPRSASPAEEAPVCNADEYNYGD